MSRDADVVIVGGGIMGLAQALAASRRGLDVVLLERDAAARRASVRNFGTIWPIGQPAGERYAIACEGRGIWLEVAREAGLWHSAEGSLHAAHAQDEMAVMTEFAVRSEELGYAVELVEPRHIAELCPAVRQEGLQGGLFSPTELCINPREAIPAIARWLAESRGVRIEYGAAVNRVDEDIVETADGRSWDTARTVICSGDDLVTLFPAEIAEVSLRRCKLQMMRTPPQPEEWRLGPLLAFGLTLRHYPAFEVCATLDAYRARVRREQPELDRHGIHVLVAQHGGGEVVLGDSHDYDEPDSPFDSSTIEELVLSELRRRVRLPVETIATRWHGTYAQHPSKPVVYLDPAPGIRIVTGVGGAGMTMSFALAERMWADPAWY